MSEDKETAQSSTLKAAVTKGSIPGATAAAALDQESQMTCSVLCELSASAAAAEESSGDKKKAGGNKSSCAKQLQLPMFLSKTYHMIEKCDPEIASWSEAGDNFVVKNVEKFATNVLPLYFKHSNFSSFARQLNFYGFRKLRSETILTSDIDPRTACYVRFFHEKFQRDKPELLQHIKRATKSEQHSKDDMDSLKSEITRLRESQVQMKDDYDRRLAELSYECNRRITSLTADLDKLLALVQPTLRQTVGQHDATTATAVAALRDLPTRSQMPDLLHSLSHAAVSLQNHLRSAQGGAAATLSSLEVGGVSRPSEDKPGAGVPPSHQHFLQAAMNSLAAGAKRPSEDRPGTAPPSSRPRFN